MFIDRLSLSPTVLYTCLDLKSRRFAAANDHDDKSSVSGDDLHLVLLGIFVLSDLYFVFSFHSNYSLEIRRRFCTIWFHLEFL
ncbi:MAG: hypothetical protein MHMPM18_003946 [Marteilia pararefringens]